MMVRGHDVDDSVRQTLIELRDEYGLSLLKDCLLYTSDAADE